MQHNTLAFDPGQTTGWAFLDDEFLRGGSFHQWSKVEDLIRRFNPEVVVIEDFRLYPWKAQDLYWNKFIPARVIGAIECICQQKNQKYVIQSAQERTTIKIVRVRGFNKHAYDAARHAIKYALGQGWGGGYPKLIEREPESSYSRDDGLERIDRATAD